MSTRPVSQDGLPTVYPGKVEQLCTHLIYGVATGRWEPGQRLPAIRDAEQRWQVNRLTVLAAYRRLVELGLAEARGRGGYCVLEGDVAQRLVRHKVELENLHQDLRKLIRNRTPLLCSAVLQWMQRQEEFVTQREAEVAFVECSLLQAQDHAGEIRERLGVHVLPMCVSEIQGRAECIPRHVRLLLTTGFHLESLQELAEEAGVLLRLARIEVAPGLFTKGVTSCRRATVLELDAPSATDIRQDLLSQASGIQLRAVDDKDPRDWIARHASRLGSKHLLLLSPRVYSRITPEQREDERIRLIRYRIQPSAWNRLADDLGLPLGELGKQ